MPKSKTSGGKVCGVKSSRKVDDHSRIATPATTPTNRAPIEPIAFMEEAALFWTAVAVAAARALVDMTLATDVAAMPVMLGVAIGASEVSTMVKVLVEVP